MSEEKDPEQTPDEQREEQLRFESNLRLSFGFLAVCAFAAVLQMVERAVGAPPPIWVQVGAMLVAGITPQVAWAYVARERRQKQKRK